MDKQVEVSSQETVLKEVEWTDATGWTREILGWLLAWIDVVEWKHGIFRYGSETSSAKVNGKAEIWSHQRRDFKS